MRFQSLSNGKCAPIIERAEIDGFGFDVELLFLAKRAGLRLRRCRYAGTIHEGSKVHIVDDSLRDVLGGRQLGPTNRAPVHSRRLDGGCRPDDSPSDNENREIFLDQIR